MGDEKRIALLLMRKYFAYFNTDKVMFENCDGFFWTIFISKFLLKIFQQLQIKSVIVKEGLTGIIYVEAFKQQHVVHAVEEVHAIRKPPKVSVKKFFFNFRINFHFPEKNKNVVRF